MGKFNSGWIDLKNDDPDEARKKSRIKDLDQLRKNVLGRKRDLRSKDSITGKPKSDFIRTLNKFASQRSKIEEATGITSNLISSKPRIIKQEVIKPRDVRGFLRAGFKGQEVHRSDPELEKFRNGVLQGDVLQCLQTVGPVCHRSEQKQQSSISTKSPIEDDHADLKMEVANILKNFNSSDSSSFDMDNPGVIEFPSSPVIGRCKGTKKKPNQVKASANGKHKNLDSQENDVSLVNNINKGERFRRQLFNEAAAGVNNRHKEILNNVPCNNETARNSTPENVIFYSEVISNEPVNKIKKPPTIDPTDPNIIKSYVQICKFVCANELKNMFRNKYKDPEEKAREALKLTYKRVLKDFAQRQNCQSKSDDETTPSSHAEVLLEPDSDIVRRAKKNIVYLEQKESTTTPTNSTDSTQNFVNKVNARSLANTVDNNIMKRKYAPSSKSSEPEVPSSTQAIADPKSVRADLKMNNIHPDRQELVARFLEDQTSFTSEASQPPQERLVCKEKLYIDNNSKASYYVHKSTKYVPAILRKNRSLVDCIAKEKATILGIENYPSHRNKSSILALNLDDVESERTPNTITEALLEAPKSKYNHMNAKYNQPSRINMQIVQENRHHRNLVPERYTQSSFASPNSNQKNFILTQTYNLSPIKHHQSYSQDTSHDFRLCQLSQDSQTSNNGNGLTRMVSFGDIQDRTNRLTLCSQNQNCSQETKEHAYASQHSHSNFYYQPCESTSNGNLYKNQPHQPFVEPLYNRPNCDCSSNLHCMDRPPFIQQNGYQVIPQNEYSFHDTSSGSSCCHQPNSVETMQNSLVPIGRQPIKYRAAEDNRRAMPIRAQAIYNLNESYSSVHKQPCYSNIHGESSDFEYLDMLKMNYAGGGGDRPQSFAPPNGNQRYIVQRQQQQQQMPPSPPPQPQPQPVCQQVAYRHNHRNANEVCKMNDPYLHQMNRQMHSKRQ